jgi:hypothetical protein
MNCFTFCHDHVGADLDIGLVMASAMAAFLAWFIRDRISIRIRLIPRLYFLRCAGGLGLGMLFRRRLLLGAQDRSGQQSGQKKFGEQSHYA